MEEEIPLPNTASLGGLGLRNPGINMFSEEGGSTKTRDMRWVKPQVWQPMGGIS